jgi:F0F1-type ATP synthase assembly protein I
MNRSMFKSKLDFRKAVVQSQLSHVALPIVHNRKWKKKALCLSVASFKAFPFFVMHNWAHEVQRYLRRLFWVTFFGEAKKVTGCRVTPDQR